jgi:hypothetical protein
MNPVLDELGEGATSITGFGFASHAGFGAGSADASPANSSGEHDTSFTSLPFATRGRDCANTDTDKIESAKAASKTRGNSFSNSIDRELPSPE